MTIYQFTPTIGSNFTFNPVLDGNNYQATVTWNVFGQRWYLNLSDSNGNLVICTALVSSDDEHGISSISWDSGVVTVVATVPHFLSLGTPVVLNISGNSPDGYNGLYLCSVTGPSTFTYPLTIDPGQQVTLGSYGSIVDLCYGMFANSTLAYYANNNQFVTTP